MKYFNRLATVAIFPIALSACGGFELQDSEGLHASGGPFFENAYAGYIDRAHFEADQGHYPMADVFAIKAREAVAGRVPTPSTANDTDAMPVGKVTPALMSELAPARAKLVAMLAGPDRNLVPGAAAQALVMYDCWVEEESYTDDWAETDQPDDAAYCKKHFMAAMSEIDAARPRPVAAFKPTPPPAPPMIAPSPTASNYLVFFDWDSSTLTAQSQDLVRTAVTNAMSDRVNRIMAVGYADSSGGAPYNVGLSERRADAVRGALIAAGVPSANIVIDWKGESELLVQTADNVREPQNRRAEIIFNR